MDNDTKEALLTMIALTVAIIALVWMVHILIMLPGLP